MSVVELYWANSLLTLSFLNELINFWRLGEEFNDYCAKINCSLIISPRSLIALAVCYASMAPLYEVLESGLFSGISVCLKFVGSP